MAGVVPGNKGAAEERQPHHASHGQRDPPEGKRRRDGLRGGVHRCGAWPEEAQRAPDAPDVERQSGRPVRREPVGRHARALAWALRWRVLLRRLQAAAHHPPAHEGLGEAQAQEAREANGQGRSEHATDDEVSQGNRKEDTGGAPPHSVEPLNKVDALELLKLHAAGVQALVLWVQLVLLKLLPPGLIRKRQATTLDAPVCHGEAAACEAGVTANGNHGDEHA
mmetsp:Transcript_75096/g.223835  ORF Transcript_75096/g.223835 Transcript_75096/m.223835 type:complete len:223 (+) Transcript_75096:456-1124(+)